METIAQMPLVQDRVDRVREMRLASSAKPTVKMADSPQHFFFECIPSSDYIVIPEVSSCRREYVPCGFLPPSTLVSNKLWVMENAGLYEFGVLSSLVHNAWMRRVTGRLKSDYQYSGAIVYNNFVWPDSSADQREKIEECAHSVLNSRAVHSGATLAELYDPDKMPADLLAAHKALDAAVEAAYGVDFGGDEEKIVAHLFKLYAEKTAGE